MQLFYAAPSPYARKVRVVAAEKGISGIDLVTVSPFDLPPDLVAANPLSKVPALLLDDGTCLYDSPVICEYLDRECPGPRLIPADGPARWTTLRLHALADGLTDTALALALEINRRPEGERSPQWIERWCATIRRTTQAMEREISHFGPEVDLAQIAFGCALAYLDLRTASLLQWRDGCPGLAAWFAAFDQRPAMQATRPE